MNILSYTRGLSGLLLILTLGFQEAIRASDCTPAPSGMVAWWAAEGNANDSVGTNNGVLEGGVNYAPGEVGQAFSLDGTSGYVFVPASSGLNVGLGGGLTVEGWIETPTMTAAQIIVEWQDTTTYATGPHMQTGTGSSGNLSTGALYANIMDTGSGSHMIWSSPNVLVANQFQHVALTYDQASGVGTLYVNGSVVAQSNLGTFTPQTSFDFYLGTRLGGSLDFEGQLDEISVYDRALSTNEIMGIYNAGSSGKCPLQPTPPVITVQPASQTNIVGGTTTFTVGASGTPPLTYQWSFNGTNILNATNTTLTLVDLQFSNAGYYSVLVTSAYGMTNSALAALTVNPPPPCDPAPSGIVAWWAAEGNANDSIGTNNGVLVGAVGYASGEVGQGFVLDGVQEMITVGNPTSLQLQNCTIEAWIKRTSTSAVHVGGGNGVIFGYGAGGYSFYLDQNGTPTITQIPTSNTQPAISITDTNFHHLAVTKSGGTIVFYVDGTPYAAPAFDPTFTFTTVAAIGGRADTLDNSFLGVIDEVSIYDRALSTNEILAIYNAGSSGKCPEPVTIIQSPSSQVVAAGSTALFSVIATGSSPLDYQWRLNATNLVAETNSVLTLTNLAFSQAGNYDVVVSNYAGSVTSAPAVLGLQFILVEVNGQPDLGTASTNAPATISILGGYAGGYLFYTLDGSTPSMSSTLYTGPFALMTNATVGVLSLSGDFSQSGTNVPVSVVIIPTYSLQTSIIGRGTLATNPPTGLYASNSVVTLTATPALYWAFSHWAGDVSGTSNTVSVTMDGPHNVQAVFVQDAFPLTLSTPGGGSATANGVAIPAGTYYPVGTAVSLLATPANGWVFLGWQGSVSSTNNPLSLPMNQTNTVQAIFGTMVGTNSTGGGIVLSAPNPVPYGTILEVAAVPNPGNYFVNWTGTGSGPSDPYKITVTTALPSFGAVFAPLPAGKFSLTTIVNGNGYVTVSPQTGDYSSNATVLVYAYANAGAYFFGWMQGATGTVSPLTVVMNSNKVIQANFGVGTSVSVTPASQTVLAGSNAVFSASAMGVPPLAYRWWNSLGPITLATSSVYTNNNTQPTNAGNYWVVVSNSVGSVTSSVSVLTVIGAPVITNQPVPVTVIVGHGASFGVGVGGWPAVAYQWQLNGGAMAGATNPVLIFTNAFPDAAGVYAVAVTNIYGCVTSLPALLTVLPLDISTGSGLVNGHLQFTFDTATGLNYEVQYSTNLVDWYPWLEAYGSGQPFTLSDPNTDSSPQRFYRVVLTSP